MSGKPKRKRAERKKESDGARNKTRIYISDAFQKWRDSRDLTDFKTDVKVAIVLPDM